MAVVNGQAANATNFNNAYVSKSVNSIVDANVSLADGRYFYLKGNETTDDSFRIGVNAGVVVIEQRSSGTWITLWSVQQ